MSETAAAPKRRRVWVAEESEDEYFRQSKQIADLDALRSAKDADVVRLDQMDATIKHHGEIIQVLLNISRENSKTITQIMNNLDGIRTNLDAMNSRQNRMDTRHSNALDRIEAHIDYEAARNRQDATRTYPRIGKSSIRSVPTPPNAEHGMHKM